MVGVRVMVRTVRVMIRAVIVILVIITAIGVGLILVRAFVLNLKSNSARNKS